jgi:hypothetical protein
VSGSASAVEAEPTSYGFATPPEVGAADGAARPPHHLLVAEVVNAHLIGRRPAAYRVVGELRAVPNEYVKGARVECAAAAFRFRLKNTHRIEQLKVNEKFVRASGGEYAVSLPQMAAAKPVPLIKYVATSKWRPVPAFVDAALSHGLPASPTASTTLSICVEANPQLKAPLRDVALRLAAPPGLEVDAGTISPGGGSYSGEPERALAWSLPHLGSGERSAPHSAQLSAAGGAALGTDPTAAELPVQLQFGCDGVTISGLEIETQLGPAGQPVDRLLRRFSAGDYKVSAKREPEGAES